MNCLFKACIMEMTLLSIKDVFEEMGCPALNSFKMVNVKAEG